MDSTALLAIAGSLIVSLASLVCLLMLPFFGYHKAPPKKVVEALTAFGAGMFRALVT
jgi:hypothetical protein